MTAIVVSRALVSDLGNEAALDLAQDFQAYKAGGPFGDPFGRDKKFAWPTEVVENELWHVHIEDPSVYQAWDSLWSRNFPQENFTSNTILVYGRVWHVQYSPHLLLTILKPDGHAQMDDKERMKAIGQEFEAEVDAYSRRLEGEPWLILR
ncbi:MULTISPECIES: type II toxin-antitoxin system YafO family toxin [Pseudomonas]|uniref:Type II toxin-antitoxin system YafO family toxin n=1 Tax=Pseudomonas fragi TaxID=296 RepID=A0ABT4WLX6_PSEFR|nr:MULTISPECIES: type II toxin-antitoxin system YafO family toxin [Pseudomonas]KOX63859.1 hypothetical protein AA303_17325 [Pseudomonas psychrophila]MDA7021075.1 type II toxin-antitoxin system YafO family toxin [Pseudomonas fragi]